MRKILMAVVLLLFFTGVGYSQGRTISGHVYDADGNAIPFASISEKGTQNGTSAGPDGSFNLTLKSSNKIVATATGYEMSEITVSGTEINVILKSKATVNDEVVVTAGGFKTKKREIGTAGTVMKADVLTAGKSSTIGGGLQGKAAGMMVNGLSGGVNPTFRVVLRGQRSLTGNNTALLVVDNIIVPNDVFGNINPNDVEEINVLNGAGAAALYGSQASNGAIIITTKKGRNGQNAVTLSHTLTAQAPSFFPKIQDGFGAGGSSYGFDANGTLPFSYIENQSYGPAYNGALYPLGAPLENGRQDSAYYQFNPGHNDFWVKGYTNQSDISLTSGDDKSTLYFAGQFANITGTTPNDKYNRATLRLNGTRKINKLISLAYSTAYTQNRYDLTTQTGSVYGDMLNMPSNVIITKYKNWRTDPFANPIGYYNPWYQNPYFKIDNNRGKTRNDYLTGNFEIKFSPIQGLDIVGRQGISTRNYSNKSWNGAFTYSEYSKHTDASSKADISANVSDNNGYTTELITDGFAQYNKKFSVFSLTAIGGVQLRSDETKTTSVSGSGLVIPDLFNVSNRVGEPGAGESNAKARQVGVYGDVRIGYKNFLYLHATGRQDRVSVLNVDNNKFFYPSVDVSFIVTDALDFLKDGNTPINYLKLRAGWSKVGQVNLGGFYGAYQLLPTYGQAYGFPFGSNPGFTAGGTLVDNNLKPEITKAIELGFDLNLFKDRFTSAVTYYTSKTDNQTVTTSVSATTGFGGLRTNVGSTTSSGLEVTAHVTPLRLSKLEVTVGGNYTYLDNKVESITPGLSKLAIATYGSGAGSYAIPGQQFPVVMGYDYKRDPSGKVIVDGITGLPTKTDTIVNLGSAVYKHRLGVDASVRYGNFTFSCLFEYRGGAIILNNMGTELDWSGTGYRTAIFNRDRFVFPNSVYLDASGKYVTNTNITVKDGNGNAGFWTDGVNREVNSNYISSADFWKMREAVLSYDVPLRKLGNQKIVKGVKISLQGRNLLVFFPKDNYYTDPEFSDGGDTNGIGLTGLGQTLPSRYYGGTVTFRF